ncbi:MAG: surface carbohydrate biosynthesis protein [Desulfomicrobium sp.]
MKLYITVETTSRELDAKTLLACCAAEAGFDVVIGLEDMVRRLCRFSEPGIFLDKSLHSEYPVLFKQLKKMGYLIAVSDEEGLAGDFDQYCKFGVGEGVAETVDMIFAWGGMHRQVIYKAMPGYAGSVIEAGNPRMDILGADLRRVFDSKVQEIKKEYGDFILVNTRYGFSNNVIGGEEFKKRILRGELGEKVDYLLNFYDFEEALWDEFLKMTELLSRRYPSRKIILRPHPSESIERWQTALHNLENVKVVREGNVHPWILASDLLIHNGCSTAIEALLLDVPCVCYRPILSEECDVVLPNSVSYNVYDMDSLCRFVERPYDYITLSKKEEWKSILKKYIFSISGKKSIEIIIDGLVELSRKKAKRNIFVSSILRCVGYVNHIWRVIRFALFKKYKRRETRLNSKWVPCSLEKFTDIVRGYGFYNSNFKNLDVDVAYYDCFRIRK